MRFRSVVLGVAAALAACGAPPQRPTPATPAAPAGFVVPTIVSNGRIDIAIRTRYVVGSSAIIPITVSATRGQIAGPVAARILASGINEPHRPAEVLVRTLAVTAITVSGGQRGSTTVAWDGRDEHGDPVPADAYSLLLDFENRDGAAVTTAHAGATLQWDAP